VDRKPRKIEWNIITGTYIRTRLHNFENGYTIFEVKTRDGPVTCTGKIVTPHINATVKVTGEWMEHEKYGKRLTNCSLVEIVAGYDAVYNYLTQVPGVGPETADAVASHINGDLLEIARKQNADTFLMATAGITAKRAKLICNYVRQHEAYTSLFLMLSGFSTGAAAADRIYTKYGESAVARVLSDPYTLGIKYGLTFAECEHLAVSLGIPRVGSPTRSIACAIDMLNSFGNDGDCCINEVELAVAVRKKINSIDYHDMLTKLPQGAKKPPRPKIAGNGGLSNIMAFDHIIDNDSIIRDHGMLYAKSVYWQEVRAASGIRRIIRTAQTAEYDPDELCDYAEAVCGVKYAEQQREAFRAFRTGGMYILTGGPGTGKTTVVKGLLAAYEKLFPGNIVRLCAPTGRASQRMKEATGREACTVHRLLEYHPYGDSFSCKNEATPVDADLIVVDESSMISIDMAELLFNAVKPGAMVLLVGDTAQLPSVGPGNVLADIIRSGLVPVTSLTKTHRQGANSPIIENARRITEGNHRLIKTPDFVITECAEDALLKSIRNQYMLYHKDDDPFAVQVLTTTRRDQLKGCNAMSRVIQEQVNPHRTGGIRYGDTIYYAGDKIMMTHNNYNIGYFNGDIGLIRQIIKKEVVVEINGELIHVPSNLLCDMSLAYATTIHKSQGSEYDVVIVVIPSKPISMLQRNIIYTGITRARKRVILIASNNTIFTCVNTVTSIQRKTMLCERLCRSGMEPWKIKPELTRQLKEGGIPTCFEANPWKLSLGS